MSTPFKMKGWSPFTLKTHPEHPVTPPTGENRGTLKGKTKFETDFPTISKVIKYTNPISTTKRKIKNIQKIGKDVEKKLKKSYRYFTKR